VASLWRGQRFKVTSRVAKQSVSGLAFAIVIAAGLARAEDQITAPVSIAVADFDYVDTSGEVRDQRVEHEARLQTFMRAIRDDLARSGHYRIVVLACSQAPCAAGGSAQLMKEARSAGATRLLYGGIHKESTLIQWMKVEAVEVESGKHLLYVQQRLACSVGRQAYRGNSQKPRSSDSRVAGNQDSEVYRQGLLRGDLRVTGP
jgi:Protein of unknown function (DUF2380)